MQTPYGTFVLAALLALMPATSTVADPKTDAGGFTILKSGEEAWSE